LLQAVARELASGAVSTFPWARERTFVVQQETWLLLCDRDAVRPGPHRFLDATRTIEHAARGG
jgi:hypothetical protein